MRSNEATSVDLKVIDQLCHEFGWKPDDTLFYQQEYNLTPEQKEEFKGVKSVKPDIILKDINGDILAVFENKFIDEKKGLAKLRNLYYPILRPRFLYACSPERILFYDTAWRGLDAGEFRQVDGFMTREEMKLKIEQERHKNTERTIRVDTTIAGGFDSAAGKDRYYQTECVETLLEKFQAGKQKMLVHMATGLGKTRTIVSFTKALLEYGLAKRVLFVVDRIMLAEQALDEGFSLISKDFPAVRVLGSNYRRHMNANIFVVVIDTLENIYTEIPNNFFDILVVDECHRSININRSLIFDHFICPRIGLTATPRTAIAPEGHDIPEDDLAILDTYRLFGCETGDPDYQFDLDRGIREGFLAPYKPIELKSHLTQQAEETGVEFNYVLDPDERKKIELGKKANINLEQLDKKYISIEQTDRIAELIRQNTEYGEKMILFAASQAHCYELVKALNRAFGEEDVSSRYAEAIISENGNLNRILKEWFKRFNRKPYIIVSVDIMSTGVDIPCLRYVGFAMLTKSVGKYIQMIGRGTRLDPKTGKSSFKVLDFFGLCKRMEDNGRGTAKENVIVAPLTGEGGGAGGGGGKGGTVKGNYFLIDNPDPARFVQRVAIHGDNIEVIDNVPIEQAKAIFEQEAQEPKLPEIAKVKQKVEQDNSYTPTDEELELIRDWMSRPEIYLDEGNLQRIYQFPQGTTWDFFLHATKVKNIPTLEQRIQQGFDSYLKTYNFTDEQIRLLRMMRDIYVANIASSKKFKAEDIFMNPIYEQFIGSRTEVEKKFEGRLDEIITELENIVAL
jgi:type I restriction enzyme, R subunit